MWWSAAATTLKVTVAVGVMTRESSVSVDWKASAPAVVDFTVKVTTPGPLLGPEAALMVGEPGPEDFARVTVLPETGLPLASRRVTVTVEVAVPSAVTEAGEATTVELEADTAAAATATVYCLKSVPALFVAVSVNVAEPAEVGVPDTTPVEEFKTSPPGRAPDDTANVIGAVPVAVTVAEYGVPTVAAGSELVVIDGANGTERTDTELLIELAT